MNLIGNVDELLRYADAENGLSAEELRVVLVPLFREVAEIHEFGHVAPLRGLSHLLMNEFALALDTPDGQPTQRNRSELDRLQKPFGGTFEFVGTMRLTRDVDRGSHERETLDVRSPNQSIESAVYVTDYEAWEHQIGHHDQLADISVLGLLLASLALGLNFRRRADLAHFVSHRRNLLAINGDLHSVVGRLIFEMTELDRNRRAADLLSLAERLDGYRLQSVDFAVADVNNKTLPVPERRRAIAIALRDRLFEINRRNRLIYFSPTAQSVNLTEASVPLRLDPQVIQPDQIVTWKGSFAENVLNGKVVSLNALMSFEDASYLPGTCDRIISQARRDRTEYGFGQLRLVVCFLRWHNLKEIRHERINSPLLLLPVEVVKRRGVRDTYTLTATSTVAEVNPALRHHLKVLYAIDLPATLDLREQTVQAFHAEIARQVAATEPGVSLEIVERPRMEVVYRRAQQRVDQYRRRQRAGRFGTTHSGSWSYRPGDRRPHGIQLFDQHVRYQIPEQLRADAGARTIRRLPSPQMVAGVGSMVPERKSLSLTNASTGDPFRWEFDLCALTIANFNYRKMSLVRDYSQLISGDVTSDAFDRIFSLDARPFELDDAHPVAGRQPTTSLPLPDRFGVVPADGTQLATIRRARTGQSFIIQGPPGTGKSQTITNLIADYMANGKRVLFVCEKRAAIDVVYARLRQRGLDELCALIHDSQADKRSFVQSLKSTYEAWSSVPDAVEVLTERRNRILQSLVDDVEKVSKLETVMGSPPLGSARSLRWLFDRAIAIQPSVLPQQPIGEPTAVPRADEWYRFDEPVRRIASVFARNGQQLTHNPLLTISPSITGATHPARELHDRIRAVGQFEKPLVDALKTLGLQPEEVSVRDLEALHSLAQFVSALPPSALPALQPGSRVANELAQDVDRLRKATEHFAQHDEAIANWRDPLSPGDTVNAIVLAEAKEESVIKFLSGAWRALRKTMEARYNFAAHAVAPSVVSVLKTLETRHESAAALAALRSDALRKYGADDLTMIDQWVRWTHGFASPALREVRANLVGEVGEVREASDSARDQLCRSDSAVHAAHSAFTQLFLTSNVHIANRVGSKASGNGSGREEGGNMTVAASFRAAAQLQALAGSSDVLLSELRGLDGASKELTTFVYTVDESPDQLEYRVLESEIESAIAANGDLARFRSEELTLLVHRANRLRRELEEVNAALLLERQRKRFRSRVELSSTPSADLNAAQKTFKKTYATGRKELQHEFTKTMRYRSIRDLADAETGMVLRDLRPIWLMSPLSVSDTLPLAADQFDVVVFDEASQIPLEDAIPALYRAHQSIVVGDRMQLPPTSFFRTRDGQHDDDDDAGGTDALDDDGQVVAVLLDGDSFLTQCATTLPSTMLAWHYRSRSEDLIGFSNARFYAGALATVPDPRQPGSELSPIDTQAGDFASLTNPSVEALLMRSVSFHHLPNAVYGERQNRAEAVYIADLVRGLLEKDSGLTIGVAAFSEAQQGAIEEELLALAQEDKVFAVRLEEQESREDDGQFVGLFVKNLENLQGDERDVIIISVCYGPDQHGKMRMNFGPINQAGGERRLNVIFSRAKKHMAIVSSITSDRITNDHNDGARTLKQFLVFAEALSMGANDRADALLASLNPSGSAGQVHASRSPIAEQLVAEMSRRGYTAKIDYGRSSFRCDVALRRSDQRDFAVAVLIDTEERAVLDSTEEQILTHAPVLEAFGWQVVHVLTADWFRNRAAVLTHIEAVLRSEPT